MTDMQRWSYCDYEILQFIPTREFVGVWAEDIEGTTECELFTSQLDGLAVAKVTEIHMERPTEQEGERGRETSRETYVAIVAIQLADGWFQIANDSCNFAGIARIGEDFSEAIGQLDVDYLERLRGRKDDD